MLNEKEMTKSRLDVITDMTLLDGALVSSMNAAAKLIKTCRFALVKRNDLIIKNKAALLVEQVEYLSHLVEMVNNTYNLPEETVVKEENPITDPLDIN